MARKAELPDYRGTFKQRYAQSQLIGEHPISLNRREIIIEIWRQHTKKLPTADVNENGVQETKQLQEKATVELMLEQKLKKVPGIDTKTLNM
ncbi:hypothetical protein Trydic_g10376 [Trypoxylus dichotomus]